MKVGLRGKRFCEQRTRNKSQRPRDQNRKYPSTVSFYSETKRKRLLRRLQESSKNEIRQEKKMSM